jgi:hypothetical protein
MMGYVEQKHSTDCGVAALAMLCDVEYDDADRAIPWRKHGCLYGTDTKMLVAGAEALGYVGHGTKDGQLRRLGTRIWHLIPDNSLVKVPHPDPKDHRSHWVVWRKGKVYDPARGVFKAEKCNLRPTSYMQFTKEQDDA